MTLPIKSAIARLLQVLALVAISLTMLGSNTTRLERLGHQMICTCGCTQILMECNHVGCPVSPVMIDELRAQIAGGGGNTSILNWFAAKYGAIVLASPMRGGFDNMAWIAPISVFLFGTLGVALLIRFWKLRGDRLIPAGPSLDPQGDTTLRDRIRRETEY